MIWPVIQEIRNPKKSQKIRVNFKKKQTPQQKINTHLPQKKSYPPKKQLSKTSQSENCCVSIIFNCVYIRLFYFAFLTTGMKTIWTSQKRSRGILPPKPGWRLYHDHLGRRCLVAVLGCPSWALDIPRNRPWSDDLLLKGTTTLLFLDDDVDVEVMRI